MPINALAPDLDRKDIRVEMTLFDLFGPLARNAIRNTPKDFNVAKLFSKFSRPMVYAGRLQRPDLTAPEIDKEIADFINRQTAERFRDRVASFVARFPRMTGKKGLNPT